MFKNSVWKRMGMGKKDLLCDSCARQRLGCSLNDAGGCPYTAQGSSRSDLEFGSQSSIPALEEPRRADYVVQSYT